MVLPIHLFRRFAVVGRMYRLASVHYSSRSQIDGQKDRHTDDSMMSIADHT